MAKVRFTYKEDAELLNKFRYVAKAKNLKMNDILNNFVNKYVEHYEEKNGYIDPVLAKIEMEEMKK